MATLTDFLTGIANKLRSNLGTTGTISASQFGTKIDDVYSKATSDFWDAFQNYGSRNIYVGAFTQWKSSEILSPKYPVITASGVEVDRMFYGIDVPSIDASKFDLSNGIYAYKTFQECKLSFIPYMNLKPRNYTCTYYFCSNLETIEKFDVSNVTGAYANAFQSCRKLKYLTITGTIKHSGLSFGDCPVLAGQSIDNVFNALDKSTPGTTKTITFNSANKQTYCTYKQIDITYWDYLVSSYATQYGWTISTIA